MVYVIKRQELTEADMFLFQIEGEEQVLGIPKLEMLPFSIQENLSRASELQGEERKKAMGAIFIGVLDAIYEDTELAKKLKELSGREVNDLMAAWARASRVSLGKSQASQPSSKKKKRR